MQVNAWGPFDFNAAMDRGRGGDMESWWSEYESSGFGMVVIVKKMPYFLKAGFKI